MNKERLKANAVANMEIIGDVADRNVIIIDDLVDTAGTLCKAADLLKENGALSVSAYCTHGILSGPAIQNIEASTIEKLYITDTVTENIEHQKIQILSCADVLAAGIQNILKTFPEKY